MTLRHKEWLCGLVVEVKYDNLWGGWCSNAVVGFYGVGVWKNIKRGWGDFPYLEGSRWEMDLGSSFFFL
jgi:hypothetical protein